MGNTWENKYFCNFLKLNVIATNNRSNITNVRVEDLMRLS
jgi:hypothetical protein